MNIADLRVALFSGNYNYVRDGANQALNRLADYLLRQARRCASMRPRSRIPAFPATGDLVDIPAVPIPFRREYRFPLGLWRAAKQDLAEFRAERDPRLLARSDRARGAALGRARASCRCSHRSTPGSIPICAITAWPSSSRGSSAIMRRFYHRCDAVVAPSESMAEVLRAQGMNDDIGIWSRGVDREIFDPGPPRPRLAPLARHRRRGSRDRLPRPAGDGKGPRRLRRYDRPSCAGAACRTRCWWSAKGPAAPGSPSACPKRASPAF